ncbi:glycosyltransferase family 4 protein [Escherichia coli]|nr:glycosyltransferase family 4 protein [Escherichia coli]
MKMKVCLVSHEFPPSLGGAGVVASEIYNVMKKDDNFTLLTSVACSMDDDNIIKVNTKKVVRPLQYSAKLYSLRDRVDTFILNDTRSHLAAALTFSKEIIGKSVVYIHGEEAKDYLDKGKSNRFLYQLYYLLILKCKHVVFVSEYIKEQFLDITNFDWINRKSSVINNGVNIKNSLGDLSTPPELVDFNKSNKIVLVSASRIVKGKGYLDKLNFFQEFEKDKYIWLVLGTGDYLDEFKKEVSKRNLSNSVIFLGAIKRENLPVIYSHCDVFWLLPNFKEAHPLVYMEASVSGLPSIGYDKYGTKESIAHNITGQLISTSSTQYDVEKAISTCLSLDREDISKYANEKFSVEEMVHKIKIVL